MPKEYSRMQRVESLIQAEIAQLIQVELHDLSVGMITVTGVKVSPDLSSANIYIVIHDEKLVKQAIDLLNERAKFLRYHLGERIRLKKIPELHFYYDKSVGEGEKITRLLSEIESGSKVEG